MLICRLSFIFICSLHGLTDNCDSFTPLAPFLSPDLHYIALDAIGHGLSSHPPVGITLNFWDVVIYIRRVVEHLKLPKISILGHSFGGSSGLLFASVYPERVDRLVLLDMIKPIPLPFDFHIQDVTGAINQHLALEKKMANPNLQRSSSMEELVIILFLKGSKMPFLFSYCRWIDTLSTNKGGDWKEHFPLLL